MGESHPSRSMSTVDEISQFQKGKVDMPDHVNCVVSVVTASFGGYDQLERYKWNKTGLGNFCFFAFTDSEDPVPFPWTLARLPWYTSNEIKSRMAKMLSHRLLTRSKVIIYVDGKQQFRRMQSIFNLYKLFNMQNVEWMSPIHPVRKNVAEEAFCLYISNMTSDYAFTQIRRMYNRSELKHTQLLEGEWHVRRNDPHTNAAAEKWFKAFIDGYRYGQRRDQLSLPYAIRNVSVARIPTQMLSSYGVNYRIKPHTLERKYADGILYELQRAVPWTSNKLFSKSHNWCSLFGYMTKHRNRLNRIGDIMGDYMSSLL